MKKSYRGWGFNISLIVVVVLVWFLLDGQHLNQDDYNYAQFKQELADDEIKSVEVQPNRVYPTGRLDIVKTDKSEETLYVLDVSEAQSLMDKEKFTSYVVNDIPAENWLMNLLPLLLVFGAMFILFMIVMNNQAAGGGGGSKMMNFGKSRAKMTTDENRNVTFENVAGLQEEKEELEKQKERLLLYCSAKGYIVSQVVEENIGLDSEDTPELEKLLLSSAIDIIVTEGKDRISLSSFGLISKLLESAGRKIEVTNLSSGLTAKEKTELIKKLKL